MLDQIIEWMYSEYTRQQSMLHYAFMVENAAYSNYWENPDKTFFIKPHLVPKEVAQFIKYMQADHYILYGIVFPSMSTINPKNAVMQFTDFPSFQGYLEYGTSHIYDLCREYVYTCNKSSK